jgi:hypothetical protein
LIQFQCKRFNGADTSPFLISGNEATFLCDAENVFLVRLLRPLVELKPVGVGTMAKDLDLLYAGQRFPVSRQKLAEGSTVFQQMFAVAAGDGRGADQSCSEFRASVARQSCSEQLELLRDEQLIPELDGVSTEDFAYFLAMLEDDQWVLPLPNRSFQFVFSFWNC